MNSRVLSRRHVLRGGAIGLASAALAACSATPAPAATVAPAEPTTAAETSADTPAPAVPTATTAPATATVEKTKLAYATFAGGSQLEGFTKITNRFVELNPQYEVEIQAKGWNEHWQALEVQLAGGVAPDVAWMAPNYGFHLFGAGRLVDVTDFIQRDEVKPSDYVGEIMEIKFDGRYYGMPYGNGLIAYAYNKDAFDEAGVSYPNEDWTSNELAVAAKKLTKVENGQTTRWGVLLDAWLQGYSWLPLGDRAWLYSGAVYTDNGGYFDASQPVRPTVTDPAFIEAWQFIEDNICKEGVSPKQGEWTLAPGTESALQGGVVAMSYVGSWEIASLRQSQFNWDMCLVPKSPKTGERRTISIALPNSIMAGTDNLEGAWQFIKWHAEQEAQDMMAVSGIKGPMLKTSFDKLSGAPDSFKSVLTDLYLNYNWNMSTMVFDGYPEAEAETIVFDYVTTCERSIVDVAPELQATLEALLAERQKS